MPLKSLSDAAYRERIYRHMFFKTPGRGTMIPVRMKPDMLAAVDAWIAAFYEASRGSPDWDPRGGHMMTRQEAVRWIIVEHLMLDET